MSAIADQADLQIFSDACLRDFSARVFIHFGVPKADAAQAADVSGSGAVLSYSAADNEANNLAVTYTPGSPATYTFTDAYAMFKLGTLDDSAFPTCGSGLPCCP